MRKETKTNWFIVILLSFIVMFFSFFDLNNQEFIWESNLTIYSKILGILVGLSAFSGIIATYFFYLKKRKWAFPLAIINALLYAFYAISIYLISDFIIYILIFPIIYLIFWIKNQKSNIRQLRNHWLLWLIVIIIATIIFISLYFSVPYIAKLYFKLMNINMEYSENFNYPIWGKIISILINVALLTSIIFMIYGFKESWLSWQVKNILSIIFFAGVGVLNISLIIINLAFMLLSIYLYFLARKNTSKKRKLYAITGPGCVGKTTFLDKNKNFFDVTKIRIINERNYEKNEENPYIFWLNDKGSAFESQKAFLKFQKKQLEDFLNNEKYEQVLLDRHMVDSFLHGDTFIKNKTFTKWEVIKWRWLKIKFKLFLLTYPIQLECLFIYTTEDYQQIKEWRKNSKDNRRKLENKKEKFFHNFYQAYNFENYKLTSWYKLARKISKKIIIIKNNENNLEENTKLFQEEIKGEKNV